MPRIPVRTEPYHSLPRCTRHYKSKRDLILKQLGKATFINGSQFVIAFISPKGDVDMFASELLQPSLHSKEQSCINKTELDAQSVKVRQQMAVRWAELKRLEEKGEAPVVEVEANEVEEEDEEEGDESASFDPDQTLVDSEIDIKQLINDTPPATSVPKLVAPSIPTTATSTFTSRLSTPSSDLYPVSMTLGSLEEYYGKKFDLIQQSICKVIAKAWIKVIEPKKQVNFPYQNGEKNPPPWWPVGMRHKEPDHLSKSERIQLMTLIIRSPLVEVSRLELATAEVTAYIDGQRSKVLREIYLLSKEERRLLASGADAKTEITIHLPHAPVTAEEIVPESGEKRSNTVMNDDDKENNQNLGPGQIMHVPVEAFLDRPMKRMKNAHRPPPLNLMQTMPEHMDYNWAQGQQSLVQGQWRDSFGLSAPPPHLSPYAHGGEWASAPPTEYIRSPMEMEMQHGNGNAGGSGSSMGMAQPRYGAHLAPILTGQQMNGSPSPIDLPAFGPTGQMSYFPRTQSQGYMQTQQMEYLHQHHQQQQQYLHQQQIQQQHHQSQQAQQTQSQPPQQQQATFDYGSPYITDWSEQSYPTNPV